MGSAGRGAGFSHQERTWRSIEATRPVGKDPRLSRATGSPLWLLGHCRNQHPPAVPTVVSIGVGTLGQGTSRE
jgi:hypothetical protein